MKYIYRWKRWFFWHKIEVVGHALNKETNKMICYLPDGGIYEIPLYHTIEVKLGKDWLLAVKDKAEKESGTEISVNTKGG